MPGLDTPDTNHSLCACNSDRYSITNLHSGLELHGPLGGRCVLWDRDEYCTVSEPGCPSEWELRIPVVSVPVGWQRLRNTCGDRMLCHGSLSLPPVTIEPWSSEPPNRHESWSTQWAFFRASSFGSNDAGNKGYVLKNRLTGGYLRCQPSKFAHLGSQKATVNAWSKHPSADDPWWLDLDCLQRWSIVHRATGCRLGQPSVPLLEGNIQAECASRLADARQTWVLVYVAIPLSTASRSPPPSDVSFVGRLPIIMRRLMW